MAKRSGGGGLASLSVSDLQRELKKRQRGVPRLEKKRSKLMERVAAIEEQIRSLGGSIFGGGGAGRRGGGRGRAKNEGSLIESLRKVLDGKTMGVSEAADAVQAAGYKSNSPNFRTMVNAALLKKQHFKRVSRGQYTAS